MDYLVQGYVALGASAALMGLWNIGQSFRRVGNPGADHYSRMSPKLAERRRKSDAKLAEILGDAETVGVPASVVAGIVALLAVPMAACVFAFWPYFMARSIHRRLSN